MQMLTLEGVACRGDGDHSLVREAESALALSEVAHSQSRDASFPAGEALLPPGRERGEAAGRSVWPIQ